MTPAHVDPAQVAEAAFHIWVAEGKPHGRDQEHWYRALETLSTETSAATSPAPKKRRTAAPKATKTASTAAAAAPKSVKSTAKPANPAQAEAAAPKAARTTKAAKTAETAPKAAKPRARKPKAV